MGRVGTSRVFPGPAFAFGAGTSALVRSFRLAAPPTGRERDSLQAGLSGRWAITRTQLNERPRETLQFETLAEKFNACGSR